MVMLPTVGGLEMDGLMLQVLPPFVVGLEMDDLMLVLQESGDLTLPILRGLETGDFITLSGLASGGDPTMLDFTGLQVLRLVW